MVHSRLWILLPASALVLAGLAPAYAHAKPPSHHTAVRAKHQATKREDRKITKHKVTKRKAHATKAKSTKHKLTPRKPKTQTTTTIPKVGTTTTTTVTHGNTTTITKTTVIGVTTTSILTPLHTDALPMTPYTIGESFTSTGKSPLASFDAIWITRHHKPPTLPVAIQTTNPPWLAHTTWAVVPEAIPDPLQGGSVFWFGESSKPDHWTWIPDDIAGQMPKQLPLPIRTTLQWAIDLADHEPGPANLMGMHPWASVSGQVSQPAGWTLTPAIPHALGPGTLAGFTMAVWDPSTGYPGLYFAPEGLWDAATAKNGDGSLLEIEATGHTTLTGILEPPPV